MKLDYIVDAARCDDRILATLTCIAPVLMFLLHRDRVGYTPFSLGLNLDQLTWAWRYETRAHIQHGEVR
jgi:hypothetical protein